MEQSQLTWIANFIWGYAPSTIGPGLHEAPE
jgi:hypothetical protein